MLLLSALLLLRSRLLVDIKKARRRLHLLKKTVTPPTFFIFKYFYVSMFNRYPLKLSIFVSHLFFFITFLFFYQLQLHQSTCSLKIAMSSG